ncbi:DUF2809 domain-containing protein [Cytophagaceae bacterium ABcell3]|nr:DUF2809 domain-containing protein [Cytophagaceae bacterium ABcell3]
MKIRFLYFGIVLIIIVLGMSSRVFASQIPVFIADHAGDALWAAMVYFGCRMLWPDRGMVFSVVLSLSFSFFIELSQLYQAEWLNYLRSTTVGALVLGRSFVLIDFVRYTIGIALAYSLDYVPKVLNRRIRKFFSV